MDFLKLAMKTNYCDFTSLKTSMGPKHVLGWKIVYTLQLWSHTIASPNRSIHELNAAITMPLNVIHLVMSKQREVTVRSHWWTTAHLLTNKSTTCHTINMKDSSKCSIVMISCDSSFIISHTYRHKDIRLLLKWFTNMGYNGILNMRQYHNLMTYDTTLPYFDGIKWVRCQVSLERNILFQSSSG